MPGSTPGRRWQPAYLPFHDEPLFDRAVEAVERTSKGLLWGCRMCGNCLFQETSFICPMECSKGLRNGLCGGSAPEHCYVDPPRPCIWCKIYERAEKMGRAEKLMEVLPPLDWEKVGTDTWMDVYRHWRTVGGLKATVNALRAPPKERVEAWDQFFTDIRQPEWWAGDAKPHPAPLHLPGERIAQAARFAHPALAQRCCPDGHVCRRGAPGARHGWTRSPFLCETTETTIHIDKVGKVSHVCHPICDISHYQELIIATILTPAYAYLSSRLGHQMARAFAAQKPGSLLTRVRRLLRFPATNR